MKGVVDRVGYTQMRGCMCGERVHELVTRRAWEAVNHPNMQQRDWKLVLLVCTRSCMCVIGMDGGSCDVVQQQTEAAGNCALDHETLSPAAIQPRPCRC